MGEYPPTGPTSWGDLASPSLDPPSSPRQRRHFSVAFPSEAATFRKWDLGGQGVRVSGREGGTRVLWI